MRHPSGRSFLFHRATKGIVFKTGMFFRQQIRSPKERGRFLRKPTGSEHTWSKRYHTFALMNNRPNKVWRFGKRGIIMEETEKSIVRK